jgi:microcompartment protein CcmK/EutM
MLRPPAFDPSALLVAFPALAAVLLIAEGIRCGRAARRQPAEEVAVTLSVVAGRTAVVVLEGGSAAGSAAGATLVERAVRDAFVLEAVDVVEVRRPDGALLDRRHRRY